MYKTLLTSIEKNILVITINRPDKMNAINKDVMQELGEVIAELQSNSEIKSAVITGS
ncbi:MAG: enoyl-CoA hydratase/isomerase family protein, partial [Flavitalea sp.]